MVCVQTIECKPQVRDLKRREYALIRRLALDGLLELRNSSSPTLAALQRRGLVKIQQQRWCAHLTEQGELLAEQLVLGLPPQPESEPQHPSWPAGGGDRRSLPDRSRDRERGAV